MKIFKISLSVLLFAVIGCSEEQSANNFPEHNNTTTLQQKSTNTYSLEEILNGMRTWDSLRNSPEEILEQFEKYNALNLDMSQFPQGNALHAYACILNGELKFAVISEVYDHESFEGNLNNYIKIVDLQHIDIVTLKEQTYESYNFPLPTQYIQAADAINRIEDWNTNYTTWLSNTIPIYQGFNIPTYSLEAQNYTFYFGLKKNIENPIVQDADLVIDNNNGLFYDTVAGFPRPGRQGNYYLLELI